MIARNIRAESIGDLFGDNGIRVFSLDATPGTPFDSRRGEGNPFLVVGMDQSRNRIHAFSEPYSSKVGVVAQGKRP